MRRGGKLLERSYLEYLGNNYCPLQHIDCIKHTESYSMEIGSLAPNFSLKDQNGKTHTLEQYLGHWVFLFFYPQDDTPLCTTEACSVRDNWNEFKKLNVQVFGVSPDDEKSHTKFQEKFELPFLLLADPEKKALTKYEAWGEKNMYGKIVTGVKRSSVLINPEGKIAVWYKRVLVKSHIAKVLEDVRSLQ